MTSQLNKVYLSANHDILDLLPLVLSESLKQAGYNVNMAVDKFDSYMPPMESCNQAIDDCDYFLLVLTPATLLYGFRSSQIWLWKEVNRARDKKKPIILILAYGLSLHELKKTWRLWEGDSDIGDHIVEFNQDYSLMLDKLSEIICVENKSIPDNIDLKFLPAETMIDEALVERYKGELYNHPHRNREIIEACIKQYPEYHRGYFERAKEYRWHRDEELRLRVVADYDRAIELSPDNAEYYAARSHIHYDLDNWGHAMADICKAITLRPGYYRYYSTRASYFDNFPKHQIADYTRAIELNPDDVFLYERRSHVYTKLRDFDKALSDIDTAIVSGHSYGKPHYLTLRAFVFLEMGEHDKARHEMELAVNKSIELYGKIDTNTLRSQASLYRAIGDTDATIGIYSELIESENDVMDRVHLAQLYISLEKEEAAFFEYENALKQHTNDATKSIIYYFRGITYSELEDWESAIEDFTRATKLYPKNPDAFYYLAYAKLQIGDLDSALAEIEVAITMKPDKKSYQQLREHFLNMMKNSNS